MMNEVGNYPGQPWMWLYTFWYQVQPFSTSDNADAEVWALMMLLTLLLMFVPFIPGLRVDPALDSPPPADLARLQHQPEDLNRSEAHSRPRTAAPSGAESLAAHR